MAIESWPQSNPASTTLHYLFSDALGSVDTVTNDIGGIVERMSFDAHGNRRSSTAWQSPLGSIPSSTRQGFTGHHMLDVFGLIHMNGRVYDPQIGRFLQADALLDAGIQGLNRYSYVLNNPLSLTDPSGHMSVGQILRTVAAIAITVYTGGWAAGYWGASLTAGQALAVMAAGGFASGAIQSGTLKGGLTGAYTALAFYAVGSYFKAAEWASKGGKLTTIGRTAKIVAHGVVGGVSSELQGASFGSGFASAGFSELAGPLTENLDSNLAQVAASAIVGGTASRLSGGKFANGAVTAAMGWAFNNALHREAREKPSQWMQPSDWEEAVSRPLYLKYGSIIEDSLNWGDRATEYWAACHVETGNPIYGILGGLSALWTPGTAERTSLVLSLGTMAGIWAGRPFWQYYPAANAQYNSTWMTRGWGWDPPYAVGAEAREALALPPYNSATAVRPVYPSGYVRGPRSVQPQPQWGQPSPWGVEYRSAPFGD